jgi:hypothetical protein
MERLTLSPRIVNIYGYCATAILAERMVPRTEKTQEGGERYVPFWNEVVPGTGLIEEEEEEEESFEEEFHEVEAAEVAEKDEEEDLISNTIGNIGGEVALSRRRLLGEIIAASADEERDVEEEVISLEFSSFPSRNSFTAEEKLDLALQMAEAVADLHGFADGVIAHLNIHIQHWFRWEPHLNQRYKGHDDQESNNRSNNIIKLSDFKHGKLLEFDIESQTYCPSDGSSDGRVRIAII